MTAKKTFFLLVGLLGFMVVGAFVGLYFSNNYMKNSANSLINTKLDNIASDAEEQTYLQSRKNLDKYKTLSETIAKVLPKSKDQAQAVKELYRIGDETGIVIDKIQFPISTLGQNTKPVAAPTTDEKNQVATPAAPSITQAKPVEKMPGVMGIDVQIGLQPAYGKSISYDNMIRFLQKVENNRRSMQINQINVHADPINGGVTFDATLTIFVKP